MHVWGMKVGTSEKGFGFGKCPGTEALFCSPTSCSSPLPIDLQSKARALSSYWGIHRLFLGLGKNQE